MILWPLSWVLTPRALHTVNVFLIKLTVMFQSSHLHSIVADTVIQSFPQLILIAVYERYLREGQKWRESSTDTFNLLSRRMKNVPFLEHIVGSSTTDLYDAIFDVEVTDIAGLGIFDDDDDDAADDRAELRSIASREDAHDTSAPPPPPFVVSAPQAQSSAPSSATTQNHARRPASVPRPPASPSGRSTRSTGRRDASSPSGSPRPRRLRLPSVIQASLSGEIPSSGPKSPLSRLYTGRTFLTVSQAAAMNATTEASIKKLDAAVESMKNLPVKKLKEEMKELQVSFFLKFIELQSKAILQSGVHLFLSLSCYFCIPPFICQFRARSGLMRPTRRCLHQYANYFVFAL